MCRGCGQEKPLDEYHVDNNNKIDGHKKFCKTCVSERRKTPLTRRYAPNMRCTRCGEVKTRESFAKCGRAKNGTQDWCKSCMAEYHREYLNKNREKMSKWAFEWYNRSPRGWANQAIGSHRRKGHTIELTIDELYNFALEVKNCPICGVELSWGKKNGHIRNHSPSLDRINNDPVLNINNIWIICAKCNAAKGDLNMEEFVEYCRNIVKRAELGINPEKEVAEAWYDIGRETPEAHPGCNGGYQRIWGREAW